MSVNLTSLESSIFITDYYTVCSLSAIASIIVILISLFTLVLVWRTKLRLHTVRHLLMCNTSIASILYCIVQSVNYTFLIFLRSQTSDQTCRWRGYFAYLSISAISYSYLIQAISRFFTSVLSHRYRWLTTFKTHYILILVQWLIVVIIPLPAILTKDIYYRPTSLCWVPLKHLIHVIYSFFAYYIFPTLSICMIYVFIYYRVKQTKTRAMMLAKNIHSEKRDLELLRNILILLGIYLLGGTPSILFVITANKPIYLLSIVSMSLLVAVEKISMILLDRDLREVVKNLIQRQTLVMPFHQ
uniref:7 transmembrane receptor 3 n=1 Tax=Adineta vaga TaxID=104782 RepID=B3VZY9_ADIVA|nr:7 transmembrane receptor 3 [Adineta vaga]